MAELSNIQICKFGGAAVKDAGGVRNLAKISRLLKTPLVLVVSAMDKMTNAFEELVHHYFNRHQESMLRAFAVIKQYHLNIAEELFPHPIGRHSPELFAVVDLLEARLQQAPSLIFDFEYDQIVSFGELLSSRLVSDFLNYSGVVNRWVDVRHVLKTDDLYRDANVDWPLTIRLMKETFLFDTPAIYLTQGFLGGTVANITTTLGREGSDYTAAIIGYALDAHQVSIYKDVPGVLNADPRYNLDTVKLDALSYSEALELAFYGAKVIHPKTVKPLQNKQIPLYVKSFYDVALPGTSIQHHAPKKPVPVYILKTNQLFITLSPRDFSFMAEENLSEIFGFLSRYRIHVNLMQSSALNFSVCVDSRNGLHEQMEALKERFVLRYNTDVELLTIRNYTKAAIKQKTEGRDIIDSQITRNIARFVLRKMR